MEVDKDEVDRDGAEKNHHVAEKDDKADSTISLDSSLNTSVEIIDDCPQANVEDEQKEKNDELSQTITLGDTTVEELAESEVSRLEDSKLDAALEKKDGGDHPESPLLPDTSITLDTTESNFSQDTEKSSSQEIESSSDDLVSRKDDHGIYPENPFADDVITLDTSETSSSKDISSTDGNVIEDKDSEVCPAKLSSEDVITLDTTGSSSSQEVEMSSDGNVIEDKDSEVCPAKLSSEDVITLDTTRSSSSQEVEMSTDETASEKEDRGIYPANSFAEVIPLNRTGSMTSKEKSSTDGAVLLEGFSLDVDGDMGNIAEEKPPAPYPVHEVPRYNSIISGVLSDVEYSMDTGKKIHDPRPKKNCFNCLGDHNVPECPEPQDPQRIAMNKKKLMASRVNNLRYHEDCENKYGQYRPGKISEHLREALGLRYGELPVYIYRMRCMGYPPGWLKEAEVHQADMKLYDGTGQSVSHPDNEEGEVEPALVKYNPEKLISYPGFNVDIPRGYRDECRELNFPPMQKEHRKSEFKRFMELNKAGAYKKRKLKDASLRSNGSITKISSSSEMDIEDSEINVSTEIEFNPPLPEEPLPPLPPPEDSPASPEEKTVPVEEGELLEDDSQSSMGYLEAKRQSLLEQLGESGSSSNEPACEGTQAIDKKPTRKETSTDKTPTREGTPVGKEPACEGTLAADKEPACEGTQAADKEPAHESTPADKEPARESTPADKEPARESTPADKEPARESTPADKDPAHDWTQVTDKEPVHEGTPADKRYMSSSDNDTESSTKLNEDSENSSSSGIIKGVKKQKVKHYRSQSKGFRLGAAIPKSITPYAVLPDAEKWTVDVSDHINFDNLPDALGTWEKMKGLVGKVRKRMDILHADDDE